MTDELCTTCQGPTDDGHNHDEAPVEAATESTEDMSSEEAPAVETPTDDEMV